MLARRLIAVPVVLGVAWSLLLAAQPVALGKENVTARLLTPLRLDAAPGDRLAVAWALGGADEHGRREPFNAIGVYVRLLSASGGRPTTGFATPDAHPQGRYDARVTVPEGGIGGVQIGLRGGGADDTLFPLENDPFAAPAGGDDRPFPTWPALAGALASLGVLAAVARRARRLAAARVPDHTRLLP
jgi:hypothetical protein